MCKNRKFIASGGTSLFLITSIHQQVRIWKYWFLQKEFRKSPHCERVFITNNIVKEIDI